MKTLIRTILVFVALTLPAASFAMAVKPPEEKGQREVKEMQEVEISKAKAEAERQKEMFRRELDKNKVAMYKRLGTSFSQSAERVRRKRAPQYGGTGTVFVIPAAEIKAKDLVTIMEDMSVMSRILDKKLDLSPGGIFPRGRGGYGGGMGGYGGMGGGGGFGGGLNFSFFGSTGARSTEAIFLQGYGALFLIKVDFPLSPPAEEEREEEPEEDMDALWEETRREIYEPADARRRRADEEEGEEYDAEKVEEMKETLIKALKHGANIRSLKASESIIITVTGESAQASMSVGSSKVILNGGQILIEDEDSKVVRMYEGPFSDEMGFSPTVMTIRAKKSDVDSFSNGKLDFDKFRQKVQIFTY